MSWVFLFPQLTIYDPCLILRHSPLAPVPYFAGTALVTSFALINLGEFMKRSGLATLMALLSLTHTTARADIIVDLPFPGEFEGDVVRFKFSRQFQTLVLLPSP